MRAGLQAIRHGADFDCTVPPTTSPPTDDPEATATTTPASNPKPTPTHSEIFLTLLTSTFAVAGFVMVAAACTNEFGWTKFTADDMLGIGINWSLSTYLIAYLADAYGEASYKVRNSTGHAAFWGFFHVLTTMLLAELAFGRRSGMAWAMPARYATAWWEFPLVALFGPLLAKTIRCFVTALLKSRWWHGR